MLLAIFQIIDMILQLAVWLVIAQVILSWLIAFNVLNMSSGGVRAVLGGLDRVTAPIYRPIRRILPDFGGIDLSPIVVILALQILRKLNAGLALEVGPTLT
jgi:YggT family protein